MVILPFFTVSQSVSRYICTNHEPCDCCGNGDAADPAQDVKSEGVMTYAEYEAAALDTQVGIEAYVQAKQSWWKLTNSF